MSLRAAILPVAAVLTHHAHAEASEWLATKLDEIRAARGVPAIAAAAIRDGEIVLVAATGLRKLGAAERVTVEDKWHIGSCTKSMTSTLAAILVEERLIDWETTISDAFSELAQTMHPNWRPVTLHQLLIHRGGAPAIPPSEAWAEAWTQRGTPTEQRMRFVRRLLSEAPAAAAGRNFLYSNQGYAIAGAMLERMSKRPWEELMRARLFAPLQMLSAGFGAPATLGKVDQPLGHRRRNGSLEAIAPGAGADNPAAIGPAGSVHCSISDFARYAGWHAQRGRASTRSLSESSFGRLHRRPAGQDYAMGWLVAQRSWADGLALSHAGSNTMFYALMWVAPEKHAAFVVATNAGGDEAERGCNEAVAALVGAALSD